MTITVEAEINAPLAAVWAAWTTPADIMAWNHTDDEWCCPSAEVDLKVGGIYFARMETKDGSMGFDFKGVITAVKPESCLSFKLDDGRIVAIDFTDCGNGATKVVEVLSAEKDTPEEMEQCRTGCQCILNSFKAYTETKHGKHVTPKEKVTVEVEINAPLADVWATWTAPAEIMKWKYPNDKWCCPSAEVDLKVGGVYSSRMEAKDGSMGFDFKGAFTVVEPESHLSCRLDDGREVTVDFTTCGKGATKIVEVFEPEECKPVGAQRAGWQWLLNSLKAHAEKAQDSNKVTVEAEINAPLAAVWAAWTTPADIMAWNHANDEWCCPSAEVDLKVGGVYSSRMEAKDGSMGFDFKGVITAVKPESCLSFGLDDGRNVAIDFTDCGNGATKIVEVFDAEKENSVDLQRTGWQSILNSFKAYVETKNN
eukprot:TRINITY_DN121_c0_g1_i5.p1 TRINITY_DN121_c0_g1~~TRINITY_DN121_c0_g1_i5.p1  ORF type:complete len:424 (+),score=131.51 TRINITY_DN121_c0_g1_i5:73-1344(+)